MIFRTAEEAHCERRGLQAGLPRLEVTRFDVRKRNLRHFLTKPQGKLQDTYTNMTFSMPRDTAARLKEMALARGTDMQGVIELAVNEWLARQIPISEALP